MKSTVIHWIILTSILFLFCFSGPPDNARATVGAKTAQTVKGPIVMWSGTLADIPKGWRLCNGTPGTPDLRDRFVQGINDGQEIGETGGAHEVELTLLNLPRHAHLFTSNIAGTHEHQWFDKYSTGSDDEPRGVTPYGGVGLYHKNKTRLTDTKGIHDHSGVTDSQGMAVPFDNRPAYYRLAFITRPKTANPVFSAAPGCIIIWSPAMKRRGVGWQTIPDGWKICDGTGGTPDLTDRFILGVQPGQDPGETGGSHNLELADQNLPHHAHPFRTDPGGGHDHEFEDTMRDPVFGITYGGMMVATTVVVEDEDMENENSTEGGEHVHAGTSDDEGGGAMIDNRPACLRLPFLMMTSPTARIPIRAIVIWSGNLSQIPSGWQLCDGTRGTPDLRDRFVLGGRMKSEAGGSNQVQLSIQTMARHGHVFSTDTAGKHDHEVEDHWRMSSYLWAWSLGPNMGSGPYYDEVKFTDPDGSHSHTGVTDHVGEYSPLPYDNRPAYYKAAFIMRMF
jgi:microcystin-dependent protein